MPESGESTGPLSTLAMLKKIILCLGLSLATVASANPCATVGAVLNPSETCTGEDNMVNVTAYTLTKVGEYGCSSKPHSAYYNKATNELTVGRQTFSVYKNMAYGQDKDYRSAYRYRAGEYYFNL